MVAAGGSGRSSATDCPSTRKLDAATTSARPGLAANSLRSAASVGACVGSSAWPAARRAPAQKRIVAAMAQFPSAVPGFWADPVVDAFRADPVAFCADPAGFGSAVPAGSEVPELPLAAPWPRSSKCSSVVLTFLMRSEYLPCVR